MTGPWRSAFRVTAVFGIVSVALVIGVLGTSSTVVGLIFGPVLLSFIGFLVLTRAVKTARARRVGFAVVWIGLFAVAVVLFLLLS